MTLTPTTDLAHTGLAATEAADQASRHAPTSTPEVSTPVAAPAGAGRQHVHEVDVVRVLTFVAVIGVHATGGTIDGSGYVGNAALNLLHFTREAFFVLTGFVLVHSYADRPPRGPRLRRFWARRLLLVGVPYAAWTAVYGAAAMRARTSDDGVLGGIRQYFGLLFSGNAHYHLYFLLVSLQIYLALPVLLALVRRARHHLALLLAGSAALEAAILVAIQYGPPRDGVLGWLQDYCHVLLPTYLFWVLLGGVAAARLDRIRGWVDRHRRLVPAIVLAGAAAAQLWYAASIHHGRSPAFAASVFQPIMIVWGTAVVVGLFAAGRWWAARRTPGSRADRLLRLGSELSFGVYLIHPLFVDNLVKVLPDRIPAPLSTLLIVAAALAGSGVLVWLARRTPLSLPVTGRPRLRRATTTPAPAGPA
ncbi:acyltransferase [Pseudofrankia inefficax]|uniref:Acyltransferase 3 n=1 Tax=Pseudofrankia inefficax (strain DSM 45817 / CECT 9037 / DDB 130130 / EuI1c) TaxID=298654 RepID=E3IZM2_PSEI1|nr:acyltransferase [Pseudofrankia inefficax]ADP83940.1 acyltransferase 3 [Pseudofrankia inefficax]